MNGLTECLHSPSTPLPHFPSSLVPLPTVLTRWIDQYGGSSILVARRNEGGHCLRREGAAGHANSNAGSRAGAAAAAHVAAAAAVANVADVAQHDAGRRGG